MTAAVAPRPEGTATRGVVALGLAVGALAIIAGAWLAYRGAYALMPSLLAIPLGIAAVVVGGFGARRARSRMMSIIGIIGGAVAIVAAAVPVLVWFAMLLAAIVQMAAGAA